MPAMQAESSIDIAAPVDRVMSVISDFHRWPAWSPWLYIEPDARIRYSGEPGTVGHGYDWQGDMVGAGGMKIRSLTEAALAADLEFLKPFKSQADVNFHLTPDGSSTRVRWTLDSKLPFFMFFMTRKMEAMIENDYRRGLRLLKDVIEKGAHGSRCESMGVVDYDTQSGVGLTDICAIDNLDGSMRERGRRLLELIGESELHPAGQIMVRYDEFDTVADRVRYALIMPVSGDREGKLPGDLEPLEIPAGRALQLRHFGPYRHLGNAWFQIENLARQQKLKPSKTSASWERYLNGPMGVAEEDLQAEVHLPLR